MSSDPMESLIQNISEVRRLMQIHEQLGGKTPGRKHKLEVLNKSGIVLLVACWEAFIEDLASTAFDSMLSHAEDHTTFPSDVLTRSSRQLKNAQDERLVWNLAGKGWRTVLAAHKVELFKEYVGKLNTPKPKQIDALFSALIGIDNLSWRWSWKGMSAEAATDKLNRLVELRGSIAHRVAAAKTVHKADVKNHLKFIYRLAVRTSNRTRAFIYAHTKQRPWGRYTYGGVG